MTDAEIIMALRALRDAGGNKSKAALNSGVKETAFKNRVAAAKARGLTADSPLRDPLEAARADLKRVRAELAAVHKHNDTAEEIRRVIYGLREVPVEPPRWLIKDAGIEGPGMPMLLCSDWHAGEVVRKEEVGGMNEYNSKIMVDRVKRLTERTIGLVNHHMPAGVPGMVCALGGDMITGDIHQELQDTNDKYVLETVRELKSLLAEMLTQFADQFGRVFVPCVVGNHGRTTMKPRMKGRVFTNYEWNIYTDLEDRLSHDKRIQFFIPSETDAFFTVAGHRFLLTHGDTLGVKGGDGIIGALGPIMRGAIKTGKSEAEIGREFDTILMGHWHQYISTRGVIVNNCLKGYDEYARLALRAPATPASQALWFVHKKWGINTQMEVYVQDPFRIAPKGQALVEVMR